MKDLSLLCTSGGLKIGCRQLNCFQKSAFSKKTGKNGFIIPIVREAATVEKQWLGLGRPPFPCRFPSSVFVSWFC